MEAATHSTFQLTRSGSGCAFISPIGEIQRIVRAGERLGLDPSDTNDVFTMNSLSLLVARGEAELLRKAVFRLLGARRANMQLGCFSRFGECENGLFGLRFSSFGVSWPPIVDAQNNPAPPTFQLHKGYRIRCAAWAVMSSNRRAVFAKMIAVQIVKAPPKPPPFEFEPIEGEFLFSQGSVQSNER